MIATSYTIVPIAAISQDDGRYRLDDGRSRPLDFLRLAFDRAGCLQPPVVHLCASRYVPVIGWPSLEAARALGWESIAVIVLAEDTAAEKVFELAVLDRLTQNRPLNPLETAVILYRLLRLFQCRREHIIERWLPLLGFGKNPRVLDVYLPFYDLDERSRDGLAQDHLSLDLVRLLLKKNVAERHLLLDVVQTCRLGKNRQKEFFLLLDDVSRIEKAELAALLQQEALQSILRDSQITPSQKADRLKAELWGRRYPAYTEARARFAQVLAEAGWPAALHLQPAPFFNSDDITVSFSCRSSDECRSLIDELDRLYKSGAIARLLEIP